MDTPITRGIELVAVERQRQIVVKGYDAEHDEEHSDGALAMAGACYAANERIYVRDERVAGVMFRDPWPLGDEGDAREYDGNVLKHPIKMKRPARIRLLVKAAAFIVAEVDRLLDLEARAVARRKRGNS